MERIEKHKIQNSIPHPYLDQIEELPKKIKFSPELIRFFFPEIIPLDEAILRANILRILDSRHPMNNSA